MLAALCSRSNGVILMAAWQFKVCLIPKVWVESNNDPIPLLYTEDESYDTSCAWVGIIASNAQEIIGKHFSLSKSWHEDLVSFGQEKETDVHVWYEGEALEDIQVRIDMRSKFIPLLETVVSITKALSCVIFIPAQQKIIPADTLELLRTAKASSAYAFANDPEKWLNELK